MVHSKDDLLTGTALGVKGRVAATANAKDTVGRSLDETCPKCGATSGNDWSQCGGSCPIPFSPHYRRDL